MKRDSNCYPTQIPHPSSAILKCTTGLLLTVAWIVIPSNTESQPLPPELILSGNGVETIQINGFPNTAYQLQLTTSLTPPIGWRDVGESRSLANPGLLEWAINASQHTEFFRILATQSSPDQPLSQTEAETFPSSETALTTLEDLMSEAEFEKLFPNRHELYTYQGLKDALQELISLRLKVERRDGLSYDASKISQWQNGNWVVVREHSDFGAAWNENSPISTDEADFGSFLSEGNLEIKKRELAAFLANISHETTGGWATAPGGQYTYGLYFAEEVNGRGYVDVGSGWGIKASPNKSYHGRGPIQLSYTFNYFFFSRDVFGDDRLVNNPEILGQDSKIAWMSAIWFWMTPQVPKPSAHDVIAEIWEPTPDDISKNRDQSRFGMTINIINGVQECNKPSEYRAEDRIGHYKFFAAGLNVEIESKLDCGNMIPY